MATTVAEVVVHDPAAVNADAPVSEAARHMRASDERVCWSWMVVGWQAS
ncbi:MAG: hypothetical protein M3302_06510 [Actinomycetota bacterium]|nr:hypothetical protein [Actinomycetota bacterium]